MQEPVESKDSLQNLAAPAKKEVDPDTKDMKAQGEGENNSKSDNENGDRDDDDDDYDDDEFPPVHIKLPLQLDLDDIAGVSVSFYMQLYNYMQILFSSTNILMIINNDIKILYTWSYIGTFNDV